jgi:hypothetical protein
VTIYSSTCKDIKMVFDFMVFECLKGLLMTFVGGDGDH